MSAPQKPTRHWLNGLRRGALTSAAFERWVAAGLGGAVVVLRHLEGALSGASDYDTALRRLVAEATPDDEILQALVLEDLRAATDALRPVFEASLCTSGYVSCPPLASEPLMSAASTLTRRARRDNIALQLQLGAVSLEELEALARAGVRVHLRGVFCLQQAASALAAFERGAADVEGPRPLIWLELALAELDSLADYQLRGLIASDQGALAEGLLGRTGLAVTNQLMALIEGHDGARLLLTGLPQGHHAPPALTQRVLTLHPDVELPQALAAAPSEQDQGTTAPRSAEPVLKALAELGVDPTALASELSLRQAREARASAQRLRRIIASRKEALLEQAPERQRVSPGGAAASIASALATLARERASERLWAADPTLFTDDPAHHASIGSRLGWLRSPVAMRVIEEQLVAFTREAYAKGLRRALVLGMGGSALCPEVLAKVYGQTPGFLELRVLDTTDPRAVLEATRFAAPEQTLFVVASKSGSTIEVSALEAYFFHIAKNALSDAAGQHFVAITDPGSPLIALAKARGYARVFENDPNIGGRYSALSYFGLVPGALAGIDLEALLRDAERMVAGCSPLVPSEENPGLRLGAFIGGAARAGRDKLTLIASPEVAPLGAWVEQLVAESTGKQGVGVVPIDQEPLGDVERYGADRAFIYLRYGGREKTALDLEVEQFITAGHPVARIGLLAEHDLGGEFFRWEFATSAASALLKVNPFDEPNVTEAKRETARLIAELNERGALPERQGLHPTAPEVGAFLRELSPPSYLAICAYLTPSPAIDKQLAALRTLVRDRTRTATTTGYGPRFLHSTGQLHKGGPATGRFLVLTMDDPEVEIPEHPYSFGQLKRAQALGDLAVLERRGRSALHVHLGEEPESALRALLSALQ